MTLSIKHAKVCAVCPYLLFCIVKIYRDINGAQIEVNILMEFNEIRYQQYRFIRIDYALH